MIMGSVSAISEKDTRRMIAYSSVAQIGYIYMGIGLGTSAGMVAAVFHIFTHAATKALLFISSVGLYEVSDGRYDRQGLRGAAYRNPMAGFAFSVGAFSMVGFPMLSGFISKLLFATAATQHPYKMVVTILALSISSVLNAIYFLRLVIAIYTPGESEDRYLRVRPSVQFQLSVALFIVLNLVLGLGSQPIVDAITEGLSMFG